MTASEYNQCVNDIADGLYRFAYKSISDEEVAKDVVQQAFLTLWENYGKVTVVKAKSYLFTVAYRRCMDEFRGRKDHVRPDLVIEHLAAPDRTPPDLKTVLQKALSKLTAQNRMLVLLKDYEGYSYEEIATLTGLNAAQVKVYLHRARKQLKDYLVSVRHLI
ncbi:MAG TPA: RNA polymerase sigma factor [Edaphocola sp.]|nr:RNA polymerase sigma factor [Edaphocola sp.]